MLLYGPQQRPSGFDFLELDIIPFFDGDGRTVIAWTVCVQRFPDFVLHAFTHFVKLHLHLADRPHHGNDEVEYQPVPKVNEESV
jgi:hypothetical protein